MVRWGDWGRRMSDQPGSSDWWMASDGKWYPPESHPDASPGDGWWRASDGKWYPPDRLPAPARADVSSTPQDPPPDTLSSPSSTASPPQSVAPASRPREAPTSGRSMRWGWVAAAAGVVVLGGVAAAQLGGDDSVPASSSSSEPSTESGTAPSDTASSSASASAPSTSAAPVEEGLVAELSRAMTVERSIQLDVERPESAPDFSIRSTVGLSQAGSEIDGSTGADRALLDMTLGLAVEVVNHADRPIEVRHAPRVTLYVGASEASLGAFECSDSQYVGPVCGFGHAVAMHELFDDPTPMTAGSSVVFGPEVRTYGSSGGRTERAEAEIEQIAQIYNDGSPMYYEVRLGTAIGSFGFLFDENGTLIAECPGVDTALVPGLHGPCR